VSVPNLLFLCVANSARSQMAEALARSLAEPGQTVQSAGSEPSRVNPFAIHAIEAAGLSLDGHQSKSVDSIESESVGLVITLCAEEVCPIGLANVPRMHWPLRDPDRAGEDLPDAERLRNFLETRDEILRRLIVLKERGWQ
jgi:arsenate reductase